MSKHSRTKLVPQSVSPPEKQSLEVIEETSIPEQNEDPVTTELDVEIECPRCNDVMELNSSFDGLAYFCENCRFLLKYV